MLLLPLLPPLLAPEQAICATFPPRRDRDVALLHCGRRERQVEIVRRRNSGRAGRRLPYHLKMAVSQVAL